MNIVLEESDSCLVISFSVVLEFHELHNESNCGHIVSLPEFLKCIPGPVLLQLWAESSFDLVHEVFPVSVCGGSVY